ncbi:MAG: glycogen(starch) synthase [Planctomycetota bacterium]|jgi:glycogen(starch) synthase
MKVLMLGWEFPPHISGGLGTACHGICAGLSKAGVDVTFVVPRAFGGERAPGTRVVGANQVRLHADDGPRVEPPLLTAPPAPLPPEARERMLGSAGKACVQRILVDSFLSPYLNEASYDARLDASLGCGTDRPDHSGLATEGPLAGRVSALPPSWDAQGWQGWAQTVADTVSEHMHTPAPRQSLPSGPEKLAFSGGYGEHLFEEVARYARVVATLAASQSFDLVHGHDWMTAPAAIAASRVQNKPLVMHAHALERDRSGDAPDVRVQALEALGLRAADRAVCVSHFTQAQVQKAYAVPEDRLRVLHNAVAQKPTRARTLTKRGVAGPLVLFLGRVTMQKGPEYFLHAAARVVSQRPDVTFVLSGSGDMLPRMVELSARLGLAQHVHFTGFLRGDDVERMYSQADLYVMPSVSEPFGITPLEAMALDVPVIMSKQSGVSEVIDHALKVDFWDTEELANQILAVITYGPLRETLVDHGRAEIQGMRWDVRGEALRKIYEELMA